MKKKKPISDYWHETIRDYELYHRTGNHDHLYYAVKSYSQYKNQGGQRKLERLEEHINANI